MRWPMTLALALVVGLLTGCGDDPSAQDRRDALQRAYDEGVEEARRDITAGRPILYVDDLWDPGPLRIDRKTGLRLRDATLMCGTGVDTEAWQMSIAGYRAEVARGLAAGQLQASSLAAKIPDEARLRARFETEAPLVIDTPEGTLATLGGAEITWRSAPRDPQLVAFDLVDPATGRHTSLPFNRRPLLVLWDHEGTTLVARGRDGSLATIDIPSGTLIAAFPGPRAPRDRAPRGGPR